MDYNFNKQLETVLNDLKSLNLNEVSDDSIANVQGILGKIEDMCSAVSDIIDPHLDIMSSDDQYDDPELWWSRPLKKALEKAALKCCWLIDEMEMYLDSGGETPSSNDLIECIENALEEYKRGNV